MTVSILPSTLPTVDSPPSRAKPSDQDIACPSSKTLEPLRAEQQKQWNTKNLGLRLAADALCGFVAAVTVAPLITVIDKAIMQNASGQATLRDSLKTSFVSLLRRPNSVIFSRPFTLICMVYGGTYLTANTLDTVNSTVRDKPARHVTSGTSKFAASSAANITLCLFKDQAFTRLYGTGGPPRPVPFPSYALFALRDCLTIFASFNIPPMLGPVISSNLSREWEKTVSGQTIAQFLAPASIQIFSTPLHLLGLDLYNRSQGVSLHDRWTIVEKNWAVSVAARVCRIVPAFGVGGVVNLKLRKRLMAELE